MPELAGYFRTHRIAACCLVLVTFLVMGLRTLNLPYSAPWADQAQFLGYAYNMAKYANFSVTRRDRLRDSGTLQSFRAHAAMRQCVDRCGHCAGHYGHARS